MASITLRSVKASPLTNTEIDNNFANLNTDVITSAPAGTNWVASTAVALGRILQVITTDTPPVARYYLVTGAGNTGATAPTHTSGSTTNGTATLQYTTRSPYDAIDVLAKISTVDGAGSGLDADLLDGLNSATANTASTIVARDASGNFAAGTITASLTGTASIASSLNYTVLVAGGGTGATTAAAARTNLGLAIGTDVQAYDADLAAIAGLTSAADKVPYFTGAGTASVASFTAIGRTVVGAADAAAVRTGIGAVIGTDVQAYDADLSAVASLATTGIIARTGAGTASTRTITQGTGVTVTNGDGVSGNPTIAIGQAISTTDSPTFNSLTLNGNLTVNGTTTTVNSSTLTVDDKNLEIGAVTSVSPTGNLTAGSAVVTNLSSTANIIVGSAINALTGAATVTLPASTTVASIDSATQITLSAALTGTGTATGATLNIGGATDTTANLGGITLKGATDKTILWDSANSNWTSSENWNIATGKTFKINNTTVLSSTQVLGKTIGGTSAGDIVNLDTTQTLTNKTLTLPTIGSTGATFNGATSGTIVLKATATAGTNTLTLPAATDILVARDTTETLTNKTLTSPKISSISNTGTITVPTTTGTLALVGDIGTAALTITAGSGITGTQTTTTFGANASAAVSVTLSHADTSSVTDVTAVANTFINSITFDTYGHVQTVGTATVANNALHLVNIDADGNLLYDKYDSTSTADINIKDYRFNFYSFNTSLLSIVSGQLQTSI